MGAPQIGDLALHCYMVKGNRLSLNGIWQDQISCDIQVFQHHIPGVDNRVSGHILSIGPSLVIYPGIMLFRMVTTSARVNVP